MNVGVVASRYAKALLKYVQETGSGDRAYSQACVIVQRMSEYPQLKDYLEVQAEIGLDRKLQLLKTALGEELSPEISTFVALVFKRRRCGCLFRIFHSFIDQYRVAANVRVGTLVTVLPAEELRSGLEAVFADKTGAEVHLESEVDPSIAGGFVLRMDDWRLDASVDAQMRRIRDILVSDDGRLV